MNAQHTQGPWAVTHDTDIIGTENDPENGCVGTVDVAHVYLRTVPGRTAANARLIASAPDLLAALKSVMEMMDDEIKKASDAELAFGLSDPECPAHVKGELACVIACREAIAKATGGEV